MTLYHFLLDILKDPLSVCLILVCLGICGWIAYEYKNAYRDE